MAFFEFYVAPKKIYLVLEYVEGGELMDDLMKRGSYSEGDAVQIASDIAHAVEYLHSHGMVHRDLKPENLLLTKPDESGRPRVKLSDFGFARYVTHDDWNSSMSTALGTPLYMAPEVIKGRQYDLSVDIWSLGVIYYQLLCGFPPFGGDSLPELFEQITCGQVDFPEASFGAVSASAKDLIKRMLKVKASERICAKEVLIHPWISGDQSNTTPLPSALELMRAYYAERNFKKGFNVVMAAKAFSGSKWKWAAASSSSKDS